MGIKITIFLIIMCLGLAAGNAQAQAPQEHFTAPSLAEGGINGGIKINQDRISLDLKGIDINGFLKILSLKTGMTIVPTKNVSGRINIFLSNVTLEDALDIILINQDLACDKKNNIITIMTATEYEKLYGEKYNEKRKFKSLKLKYTKPAVVCAALAQIKSGIGRIIVDEASGTVFLIDLPEKIILMEQKTAELDRPLASDIFYLDYATAGDVKKHLSGAVTPGLGEIFVDERLNKVIVYDLPEKIKRMRQLVKVFDVEFRQFYIETEVVQVVLSDEYQKGINWERVGHVDYKGTFPVVTSFSPSVALSANNFNVNVGTLSDDGYTATLQLLQTFGDSEVISRQSLSVANKREAKVSMMSREPYITEAINPLDASTVFYDKVEFTDVGLKINIMPEINDKEYVTLKIGAELSSIKSFVTTEKSHVPNIEKSEAQTSVKVKDGARIIIAGFSQYERNKTLAKIPLMSSHALSGAESGLGRKTELVIFIKVHFYSKQRG